MKKIRLPIILFIVALVSISCSQSIKDSYSIEGKDTMYVGEVVNSSVKLQSSESLVSEDITWQSSREDIATVNHLGVINALAEGVTEISATFKDNGKTVKTTKSVRTVIFDGSPSERSSLLGYSIMGDPEIKLKQPTQLTVFHGVDSSNTVSSIRWSSEDPTIASVGENSGIVTGHKLSPSVHIFANIQDSHGNQYEVTLPVAVIPAKTYEILGSKKLYRGQQSTLAIGTSDSDTSDIVSINWSSSDESSVSIDKESGKVKVTKGSGKVVISAIVDTTSGPIVLDRVFELHNGALILQYDLSQSKEITLPFSKFSIADNGKIQEFVALQHVFTIDWGDGTETLIDTTKNSYNKNLFSHDYSSFSHDTTVIAIYGESIELDIDVSLGSNLIDVENWGNTKIISRHADTYEIQLFQGLGLVNFSATDAPYLEGPMIGLFANTENFNGDLSAWDMSNVSHMDSMFAGAVSFNGDLSNWDVSNVKSFENMFHGATDFQGLGLSSWNPGGVTTMEGMFSGATSFDENLGDWDVSSVKNFDKMFQDATDFIGIGLNKWEVSPVARWNSMFENALRFNTPLTSWEMNKRPSTSLANINMFKNSGLRNPEDHPIGCDSNCGIIHPNPEDLVPE